MATPNPGLLTPGYGAAPAPSMTGDSDVGIFELLPDQGSVSQHSPSSPTGPRAGTRKWYEQHRAFYCMYPDGWFRSTCIDICCNPVFDYGVLFLIVFNATLVSIDDPLHGPSSQWWFQFLDTADSICLGVFISEMVIKMCAGGGFMHRTGYFRDLWNWLDFVIVAAGIVGEFLEGSEHLKVLRIIRIFRPLRTISRVRGMRDLVDTIGASLPVLFHVVILSAFLSYIFGLVGVILWSKTLHQRCWHPDHGYTSVCGMNSTFAHFNRGCPEEFECVADAPSPNEWANFDNIFYSNFIVLQCFTLDDYSSHMYAVQDGWAYVAAVYFVLLTLLGAYVVLNLVLAVVTDSFNRKVEGQAKAKEEDAEPPKQTPGSFFSPMSAGWSPGPFSLRSGSSLPVGTQHQPLTAAAQDGPLLPPALQRVRREKMGARGNPLRPGVQRDDRDSDAETTDRSGDALLGSGMWDLPAKGAKSIEETALGETSTRGMSLSSLGRPPRSPSNRSRGASALVLDAPSEGGHAGRSSVRQKSKFMCPAGSGTEVGTEMLLKNKAVSREWDKFRAALGRSGQESVTNYDRLVKQRTTTADTLPCPSPSQHSRRPTPLDPAALDVLPPSITGVLKGKDSVRRSTPPPTFIEPFAPPFGSPTLSAGSQPPTPPPDATGWRAAGQRLLNHPKFNGIITSLIILNALFMCMEYYHMSQGVVDFLATANVVFVAAFTLETAAKLLIMRPRAWAKDPFNLLDALIVAVSLVELFFLASKTVTVFRILRLARIVRVVKLARRLWIMQHIVASVASSLSYMGYLMLLLLLFLFVFAVLGRQLFAGKMPRCCTDAERATGLYNCDADTDEHFLYDACWNAPWRRAHFDSLYWSMITVFQIVTQDYWSATMYKAMSGIHPATGVYFVAVLMLGRYLLLNLFVAILLVGLEQKHEEIFEGDPNALPDPGDEEEGSEDGCIYPPQVHHDEKLKQRAQRRRTKTAMRVAEDPLDVTTFGGSVVSPFSLSWSALRTRGASVSAGSPGPRGRASTHSAPRRAFRSSFSFGDPEEVAMPSPTASRSPPAQAMLSPTLTATSDAPIQDVNTPQKGGRPPATPVILLTPSVDTLALTGGKSPPRQFMGSPCISAEGSARRTARTRVGSTSRKRSQTLFRNLGELEKQQGSPAPKKPPRSSVANFPISPFGLSAFRRTMSGPGAGGEQSMSDECDAPAKPSLVGRVKAASKKLHERALQIQEQRADLRGHGGHEEMREGGDADTAPKSPLRYRRGSAVFVKHDDGRTIIFRQGRGETADWQAFVNGEDGEEEVLLGKSWGCVPPTHPVRRFLHRVVHGDFFPFEKWVGVFIYLSCFLLTLNPTLLGHNEALVTVLAVSDVLVGAVFLAETLVRITVYTFSSKAAGRSSYVSRARWNYLDFIIVVVSIATLLLQFLLQDMPNFSGVAAISYSARALRAFRPLRILVRSQNMKIVISSLAGTIPAVINVFAFASMCYFMFGIVSVQLFKGAFMSCNDGSNSTFAECDPETYFVQPMDEEPYRSWLNDSWLPPSAEHPDGAPLIRRRWVNIYSFNFNNICQSLLCLLEMAIMNGWMDVLYAVVDCSTEEDGPTKRNQQEWMGLMVVLWVFVGGLGIMNVFVGCVVDYFGRLKNLLHQSAFVTKDQIEALRIKKILNSQRAKHRLAPSSDTPSRISRACNTIVHSKAFRRMMFLSILLNVACMTTVHHDQTPFWDQLQRVSNLVFNCIFTVEMLLKIGVGGVHVYLRTLWNKIDGFVVLVSWLEFAVSVLVTDGRAASVISLLRLGRALRLIRQVKGLKKLFLTIYFSRTALFNVGSLLALVFFIFGVMGTVFFEHVRAVNFNDNYVNHHYGFDHFPKSILTLYRVATFDGWRQIFAACLIAPPQCRTDGAHADEACGYSSTFEHVLVCLYFATFVLLVGFVMFNLFIAVVLENFQDSVLLPPPLAAKMELVKRFREVWAMYDPSALQVVHARHFVPMMLRLPSPLGFADCDRLEILPSLLHLDFPVTKDMDILFVDVIDALGETVFKIKLVDREATRSLAQPARDAKKDRERYALGYTIGDYHAAATIQCAWRRSRIGGGFALGGYFLEDYYKKSLKRYPFRPAERDALAAAAPSRLGASLIGTPPSRRRTFAKAAAAAMPPRPPGTPATHGAASSRQATSVSDDRDLLAESHDTPQRTDTSASSGLVRRVSEKRSLLAKRTGRTLQLDADASAPVVDPLLPTVPTPQSAGGEAPTLAKSLVEDAGRRRIATGQLPRAGTARDAPRERPPTVLSLLHSALGEAAAGHKAVAAAAAVMKAKDEELLVGRSPPVLSPQEPALGTLTSFGTPLRSGSASGTKRQDDGARSSIATPPDSGSASASFSTPLRSGSTAGGAVLPPRRLRPRDQQAATPPRADTSFLHTSPAPDASFGSRFGSGLQGQAGSQLTLSSATGAPRSARAPLLASRPSPAAQPLCASFGSLPSGSASPLLSRASPVSTSAVSFGARPKARSVSPLPTTSPASKQLAGASPLFPALQGGATPLTAASRAGGFHTRRPAAGSLLNGSLLAPKGLGQHASLLAAAGARASSGLRGAETPGPNEGTLL